MEPSILKIIADNQALLDAVKNVIVKQFNTDSLKIDMNITNETLGEITRARLEGLQKIDEAFREISNYKTVKEGEKLVNPAR